MKNKFDSKKHTKYETASVWLQCPELNSINQKFPQLSELEHKKIPLKVSQRSLPKTWCKECANGNNTRRISAKGKMIYIQQNDNFKKYLQIKTITLTFERSSAQEQQPAHSYTKRKNFRMKQDTATINIEEIKLLMLLLIIDLIMIIEIEKNYWLS